MGDTGMGTVVQHSDTHHEHAETHFLDAVMKISQGFTIAPCSDGEITDWGLTEMPKDCRFGSDKDFKAAMVQ
jgi:hypothetical protein